MKGENLQPRLLFPARISFKIYGEIKSFSDKQDLREFNTTKPTTTNIKQIYIVKKYKRRKKDLQNQPQTSKKMGTGSYISIITLNVNGLNDPTKRHRLAEQIQKQEPYICCLQETHFRPKDTNRLKVRGWKNIFQKYTCKCEAKECWSSNLHIRQNRP